MRDEIARLSNCLSEWIKKTKEHTEPWELYTPSTFPEEYEILRIKTLSEKKDFWLRRQIDF